MATFEQAIRPLIIYIISIDDDRHRDCLKIGETTLSEDVTEIPLQNSEVLNRAARSRIDQYTRTAGISYQLLHTEMSFYVQDKSVRPVSDKEVHSVLERSGIKRKEFKGAREWYCCDLDTAKRAIKAVKEGRKSLRTNDAAAAQPAIELRPEQKEAVERTLKHFSKGKKGARMLWNAKMRFGKTLSALYLVREMGVARTLIVTHRPVVNKSWFEDFSKVFHDRPDYAYGSNVQGESFDTLQKLAAKGGKYVYFASMQDLRGSHDVGGQFDKNNEIFSTRWDLLIVDEAHEGTKTVLGEAVIAKLTDKTTKVLLLSGTPFNLMDEFEEHEVFTWDYVMEQRAKMEWDTTHPGDTNPYAPLPAINIYTYDLGQLMSQFGDEDRAFNFREFFRTRDDGTFVHNDDVDRFLDMLRSDEENTLYPYANDQFRSIFRHTLWILPGVKAAKALSQKLKDHKVFSAFSVVNVAGDGDEEEESRDALQMVWDAIGPDPNSMRTITLSCGRLTAGVSVGPWTGVFMMAGSYSTSAAGYMQTIFRVQTPYSHNGRMKTECYAFDFAPDRTLRMLAEVAKVSAKAGKQTAEDRKILGDFLNFCPIIAIEGSRMQPYDVAGMLAQLKRAQIERVVQRGFEDGALYNDELLKLTEVDLKEFEQLRAIIGKTQAMPKPGDIDINRQGLTHEQYAEMEGLERRPRQQLSPDEKKRLEELKAMSNSRRNAVAILRGISIRMPLMLFGAEMENEEEQLTIDNFIELVDDKSWEEFMPRGVTKEIFSRFKRYYDPEIFREAGKRIRDIVRFADERLTIEERIARIADIFSTFRNPDKETVLTPWRVVNMHMGESLGGYCFYDEQYLQPLAEPRRVGREGITAEVFSPRRVILEINSKSGLYPLYAAYSIYRERLRDAEAKYGTITRSHALQLWDLTLEQNILVLCMTPMAQSITQRTLAGFRRTTVHAQYYPDLIASITRNLPGVVRRLRNGKYFWRINSDRKMDINAIIGNPPYQVTAVNTSDTPVYHHFVELAMQLAQRVSLITPARYLFNAGKTPEEWNRKVLNDEHYRVVWYKANSTDVFPQVDIKGGVAVMYYDRTRMFGKIRQFFTFDELRSISHKVLGDPNFAPLSSIIYPPNRFLLDVLYKRYPDIKKRIGSNGRERRLTSQIFDLGEIFTIEQTSAQQIRILGLMKKERVYRWIDSALIEEHPNLGKFKVALPQSNGSGAIGEVSSTPLIGEPAVCEPFTGATQTFITIGAFDAQAEAEACLKYVKTRFARTMLGTLKVTQDNPKDTWRFVPLQDFTPDSDINWLRPVAEIDQQLYAKYHLAPGEIAFIEEKVRAMA